MYYGSQYWHERSLKVICVGVMVIEYNFLLKHYINYWEGNTCRKMGSNSFSDEASDKNEGYNK